MPPLSHAFLASFLPLDGLDGQQQRHIIRETASFIRDEVFLSPLHLRIPLVILITVFYVWVTGLSWRFTAEEAATWFEKLGASPARNLTRLLRSLALLYALEHPLILKKMGAPSVPHRHDHFRALRLKGAT